jgi:predicted MFS family arabinose efflux permease
MFDLSLFRIPTFNGGLIAAFAMNGSLFSMLLYLVLYLQDDLGYSALNTGLRLLILSGGTLISATAAGRLSSHMPVRWLIGPGLLLVGIGLFLMAGINGATGWTHLTVGFIVAGFGSGMVNPPLASTAVGVVEPQRSGMASGVNTTFRQIGISVGIAVYGTIFTTALDHDLAHNLAGVPGVSSRASQLIAGIRAGNPAQVIKSAPVSVQRALGEALRSSFASMLNELLYVSGAVAIIGALCSMALIRQKDFVVSHAPDSPSSVH